MHGKVFKHCKCSRAQISLYQGSSRLLRTAPFPLPPKISSERSVYVVRSPQYAPLTERGRNFCWLAPSATQNTMTEGGVFWTKRASLENIQQSAFTQSTQCTTVCTFPAVLPRAWKYGVHGAWGACETYDNRNKASKNIHWLYTRFLLEDNKILDVYLVDIIYVHVPFQVRFKTYSKYVSATLPTQ